MKSLLRSLSLALILLGPTGLWGQGLTVESVVDTRFEGALGSVMGLASRMAGTNLRNIATTTYLEGHRMRVDSALSGSIFDLDAERVIQIDHKQKTYTSTTFAEMRQAFERAQASAEESRAKQKAKKGAAAEPKGDIKVKARVTVERPGQRERIAGYDTERVFVTILLEAEATPEGQRTEQVGTMVLLMDQWISSNAPQVSAFTEFYRLFSEKLGREFRSQLQGLQAVFAMYPSLAEGMEAAAQEMQKIKGIPLRSAMHFVLVPPNMAFDRQLALDRATASAAAAAATPAEPAESAQKKKSGGFGGFMKKLGTVAAEAGKKMGKSGQSESASAPPQQSTLVVMTDEVKSITTGAVAAAMFAPPGDYREVRPRSR
jgi:hypothetical protein